MMDNTVKFGKQMYGNTSKYCLFDISGRIEDSVSGRNETRYEWM